MVVGCHVELERAHDFAEKSLLVTRSCREEAVVMIKEDQEPYQVKLESFTGPLDLLLHLIRKNEVNIYDIPIALITQQYLEYLSLMKSLNLSFAGEFLVMAATLLQIKSRLLLPKDEETVDAEEDQEDPRKELVRRLVEYQQYKDVAARLSDHERMWQEVFRREPLPSASKEPMPEVSLDDLSLFDLLDTLQGVLARVEAQHIVDVTLDSFTVQDRINTILDRLEGEPVMTFQALFDDATTKVLVIVTFLGLLELVRMKLVQLYQNELFGPIRITRTFLPVNQEEFPV